MKREPRRYAEETKVAVSATLTPDPLRFLVQVEEPHLHDGRRESGGRWYSTRGTEGNVARALVMREDQALWLAPRLAAQWRCAAHVYERGGDPEPRLLRRRRWIYRETEGRPHEVALKWQGGETEAGGYHAALQTEDACVGIDGSDRTGSG